VRFIEQFEERLRALPGVIAVATSGAIPTGVTGRTPIYVDDSPTATSDAESVFLLTEVSDDYFRALGIPLLGGRPFGVEDAMDRPMTLIVSESLARHHWPNGGAVGARVRMSVEADAPRATIVGVVGDVRNDPAQPKPDAMMYMSVRQAPWNGPIFLLRTRGDPQSLVQPARRALAALDPKLPLYDVTTLQGRLAEGLSGRRLPVLLIAAFGTLALLLASVGVYAMFAAMTAAREREFGVRVALGSSRGRIARLVLRQGGVWMALGLAGGALGVVVMTRFIRELLYGVSPFDPLTLGLAVLALLACGTVALLVPVRRATRVDPISALR
jgi:putative ABC transport system permease protein